MEAVNEILAAVDHVAPASSEAARVKLSDLVVLGVYVAAVPETTTLPYNGMVTILYVTASPSPSVAACVIVSGVLA